MLGPDLGDPSTFLSGPPHRYFEYLRRECPISWHDYEATDGTGFWALMLYDDVVAAERDPRTFSSEVGGTLIEPAEPGSELLMINKDPPSHTRLRQVVSRMFTAAHVRQLEASIRAAVDEVVKRARLRDEFDFVESIAAPIPVAAISELLGVPAEDRHRILEWSNRMVGAEDREYANHRDERLDAAAELYEYAQDLAARRVADPGDDIVSVLLTTRLEGELLDPFEFNTFFLLLAVAGNAPRSLITAGALALLEFPDERRRLAANDELRPPAIEEMMRFVSPVNYFRRTATRDVELRGVQIRAGDKVTLWYSSANRDERVFDDPHRFDITRSPNDHLAFGARGPHHCIGSHLARLQVGIVFERLVPDVLGDVELAGEVERLRQNVVNGIKHMPVRWR